MKPRPEPPDYSEIVKQSVQVLKTRGRSVFLISLLMAVAAIVAIALIPDKYEATTTILVDPQKIPERYVSSTITSDPNAHLDTLTQQVLSASRLQEIVDLLNPYPDLRRRVSREEFLDYIRSKIKIELKPGSEQALSSFSISYIDRDRRLVAPVANQLAASFIEWNLKSRQQQAIVTTQFLSTELDEAQRGLEEQEAALQRFRMQHAGATPDQLNGNLQALSRLQADVQANTEAINRLDEERILISQQPATENHDPATFSERERLLQQRVRMQGELQSLRRQFTETYPDVVNLRAQIDAVNARLNSLPPEEGGSGSSHDSSTRLRLDLIGKDIERHKEQVAVLEQEIARYEQKVQAVPILETQLAELTRNYETSRQNYQSLLDKRLSAGMSEDLERRQQSERFTVLDPARTPEKPFKPRRLPLMAGAMLFAVVFPAACFLAWHFYDGTIKSDRDLIGFVSGQPRIRITVPRIVTGSDLRRVRVLSIQTAVISLLACLALIAFLVKVRPIL